MLVFALGCAKSVVYQDPTAPHPASAPVDSSVRRDSATSRVSVVDLFRSGNAVYDYHAVSTIRVATGDTIPRADTSIVTAVVSVIFEAPVRDNLTTQARITSDSIMVRTGINSIVRSNSRTDILKINTGTGKVRSTDSQNLPCTIQTQDALIRVDDIVPSLPTTRVTTWSDTVIRHICRAGIQLETHRVASYQLDSAANEARILRTTTTTFTGRGVQWDQPVESTGQSSSIDTLFFDPITRRRITHIQGSTRLQLNFRSQLRNQQFEQLTDILIQLR